MKILLVNEYIRGGGAEKIFDLQYELFKNKGHLVSRMVFGYEDGAVSFRGRDTTGYYAVPIPRYKKCMKSRAAAKKVREILDKTDPDIVIVHNVFSSPISVISSLKGRKTIVVAHDCYRICPTALCVCNDGSLRLCDGYLYGSCVKSCMRHYGPALLCKLRMLRRLERETKGAVSLFISPSQFLAGKLRAAGYETCVVNNPLDKMEQAEPVSKYGDGLRHFIYLGGLAERKGIYVLMEAIEKLADGKTPIKMRLDLFGGCEDEKILNRYKVFAEKHPFVRYHGTRDNKFIMDLLARYDYLVIPSVWGENYPTAALEAMSGKTVVIGADIGGITEILDEGRGILYDYKSSGALAEKIREACALSPDIYQHMAETACQYVRTNNSGEKYYDRLMERIAQVREIE